MRGKEPVLKQKKESGTKVKKANSKPKLKLDRLDSCVKIAQDLAALTTTRSAKSVKSSKASKKRKEPLKISVSQPGKVS